MGCALKCDVYAAIINLKALSRLMRGNVLWFLRTSRG